MYLCRLLEASAPMALDPAAARVAVAESKTLDCYVLASMSAHRRGLHNVARSLTRLLEGRSSTKLTDLKVER